MILASQRTTQANTGWRIYLDKKNGFITKVNAGTPANKAKSITYSREEARIAFEWEIKEALEGRYPKFLLVAQWASSQCRL